MTADDCTPTREDLVAVFAYAGLPIPGNRIDMELAFFTETLALIRQSSMVDLGETPPAPAFRASWE
jgi:hypothetical protein